MNTPLLVLICIGILYFTCIANLHGAIAQDWNCITEKV
jgi:hypothetical protein